MNSGDEDEHSKLSFVQQQGDAGTTSKTATLATSATEENDAAPRLPPTNEAFDPSQSCSAFAAQLNLSSSTPPSFSLGTSSGNSSASSTGGSRSANKFGRGVRSGGSSTARGGANRAKSSKGFGEKFVFEGPVAPPVFSQSNEPRGLAQTDSGLGLGQTSVLNTKPVKPVPPGASHRAKLSDESRKKKDALVHDLATLNFLTAAFPNQPPPPDDSMALVEIVQHYLSSSSDPREVASQKDWNGRTPLHHAAAMSESVDAEVMALLLQVFPEAAAQKDRLGELPLQTLLYSIVQLREAKRIGGQRRTVRYFPRRRQSTEPKKDDGNEQEPPKKLITLKDVKTLLDADPRPALEASWRDASSQISSIFMLQYLALHLDVCEAGVFEFVLNLHPEAAHHQDGKGQTALHKLISSTSTSSEAAVAALESLLGHAKVNLNAMLSIQDSKGKTPVALAAQESASVTCGRYMSQMFLRLLRLSPEAAKKEDADGRLPIQILLGEGSDNEMWRNLRRGGDVAEDHLQADLVEALLKAHPESAKIVNPLTEQTLLHLAVACRPCCHPDVLKVVCQAYPEACLHRQESRRHTPLHLLLDQVESSHGGLVRTIEQEEHLIAKIEILLAKVAVAQPVDEEDKERKFDKCDEVSTAAALKDDSDFTPLHLVASNFVQHGLNAPEGAEHAARRLHLHNRMVKMVLEACPAAAGEFNKYGRLPLHVALASFGTAPSLECIQLLIQAYPKGAETPDKQQNTALHLMLSKPFEEKENFDCVFEAYPDAATAQDGRGKTPLLCVLDWDQSRSTPEQEAVARHIFHSILDRYPCVVRNREKDDVEPLYSVICRESYRGDILDTVIQAYSDVEEDLDQDLATVLLDAVNRRDNGTCDYIMQRWPNTARKVSEDNWTVLHGVREADTLKIILRAWPEAVYVRSKKHGVTPVHCWMKQFDAADCAEALKEVKETLGDLSVAKVADNCNLFPLHHALSHRRRELSQAMQTALDSEHVRLLLEAHPEAIFTRTGMNQTSDFYGSLVFSSEKHKGKSIVGLMCEEGPDGRRVLHQLLIDHLQAPSFETTKEKVEKGKADSLTATATNSRNHHDQVETMENENERKFCWILHQVCANTSNVDEVVSVIDLCHSEVPACVRSCFGRKGRLAVHSSCAQSDCSLDVVSRLTALYGGALTVEDKEGFVPFVLAGLCGGSVDVMYHLLRSAPDMILDWK